MSILRELMTNEKVEPEVKTTYEYVLDLKDRLQSTCELAQIELQRSQKDRRNTMIGRRKLELSKKEMKFWFCYQHIQISYYYNGKVHLKFLRR